MFHRAFIARTYVLKERLSFNNQFAKRIMYSCHANGDDSIEFSVEEVLKNLQFNMLVNTTCEDLNEDEKLAFFNSLDQVKLYISEFFSNIKEFSEYYIDNEVITEVIMFYPFIRISNINNTVITSFFVYFSYSDGRKTFTVFEPIPDVDDESKMESIQNDFINTFDVAVRTSRFITGYVFEYFDHHLSNIKKNSGVINYNYILKEFIKQNFTIDVTALSKSNIVWTEGELTIQMNKSDHEQIFVDDDWVYVAYKFQEIDYSEHLRRLMNEFFTIIHFATTYNIFKKLIKRSRLSDHDTQRLKRISLSLIILIKKLKIKLSEGDQNILISYQPNILSNPIIKIVFEVIKLLLAIKGSLSL